MAAPPTGHASIETAEYTATAKWLHWLAVAPVAVLLLSGATIRFIAEDVKFSFYTLHESLGLVMLAFVLVRLWWRLQHPPPPLPAHLPPHVRTGAELVHRTLYVALVVQPILGFFTTNAYGFPQRGATAFLGFIDLPHVMEAAPDLARALHAAHSVLGWTLAGLIALHVAAIVYHHAIRDDGILRRMV